MLFAYDLPKFACNWLMPAESNLWLFVSNAKVRSSRHTGRSFPLPPSVGLSTAFLAVLPWQVGSQRSLKGEKMLDKRGDGPGMGCMLCFYSTRGSMYVKDLDQAKVSL